LQLLVEATRRAGHTDAVKFAIDPASSEFFKNGQYDLTFKSRKRNDGQVVLSGDQLGDTYRDLAREFPIALLEDPFAEDDWQSWTAFLERHVEREGNHFEIVGDDLLATNLSRMQLAHERKGNRSYCSEHAVMLTWFLWCPSLQLALAQDQSDRYHHGVDCCVCRIPRINNRVASAKD
jgi:enolase